MAHFRGTVEGSRGEASRLGTKNSGLLVSANGWDIGVDVELDFDEDLHQDVVRVFKTEGTNNPTRVLIYQSIDLTKEDV